MHRGKRRSADLVLIAGLALGVAVATPADAQQRPDQGRQQAQQAHQDGAGAQQQDRMIEDHVIANIAERAGLGPDIQVRVDQGTVTLSGTVPSQEAERRALRAARRTPGVDDVRDELQVSPQRQAAAQVDPSTLNRRVAQQIASQIQGAKAGEDWWFTGWRVEGPDNDWNFVVESSEDGRVALEGEVPRYELIRQAVDAARKVSGVRSVESRLEIDPDYGYGAPYLGRRYGPGYPYGYGYARPYGVYGPGVAMRGRAAGTMGSHTITGTVTSIDRQAGRVTLRLQDGGQLTLPVPATSLEDTQQGDRLTLRLDVMRGDSPAASPRDGGQQQRRQP